MIIINGIEMDDGVDEPNTTPICKACKQPLDDESLDAGEHSLCDDRDIKAYESSSASDRLPNDKLSDGGPVASDCR
jgi:hypothetical protein